MLNSQPIKRAALVVEDDIAIREALADVLRSEGYKTSAAEHGREALEQLRSGSHPDVILLDLMMPVMDGWQFRVEQRRDAQIAGIPVVALTADGTPKATAIDADAFLKKPIGTDALLSTIDRVVLQRENRVLQTQLAQAARLTALGTLAAGVAHEVNNPLSYVLLNMTFVMEQLPTLLDAPDHALREKVFASLEYARHGAERIRAIVGGMKAFARPEDGSRRPVDVRQVVESCVSLLLHEINGRARLVKDYAEVPPVDANETSLAQVFLNLLLNAMQSLTDREQNEIVARVWQEPPNVLVEIRDSGQGIPEEIRGRIFEPFFTTKPVGVGTGMGLAICHGIVRSLGGEITFTSEVGRGSAFRVTLPARAG